LIYLDYSAFSSNYSYSSSSSSSLQTFSIYKSFFISSISAFVNGAKISYVIMDILRFRTYRILQPQKMEYDLIHWWDLYQLQFISTLTPSICYWWSQHNLNNLKSTKRCVSSAILSINQLWKILIGNLFRHDRKDIIENFRKIVSGEHVWMCWVLRRKLSLEFEMHVQSKFDSLLTEFTNSLSSSSSPALQMSRKYSSSLL